MDYWNRKLIREQLDHKLAAYKLLLNPTLPEKGWIRMMREALGMTSADLAKRTGIQQASLWRIENAEQNGEFKLSSMRRIAEGLNMKFVYALLPENTLEAIVHEQAKKIALERLQRIGTTMRLENQELSSEEQLKVLKDMIEKLLIDESKDLWKE
ncbi:MAG: mobile mystery protein A [Flavobacteriales bacterium]|jgi:predicted DNA-binding mobile mystery protein A